MHIDAEPHGNRRWHESIAKYGGNSWEIPDQVFQDYLVMARKIREHIDAAPNGEGFEFSAAIGHWYHEETKRGHLHGGNADNLCELFDFLVPMIYDGVGHDARQLIECSEPEMQECPLVVGASPMEYQTYGKMMEAVDAVMKHYGKHPNFRGVSLFHSGMLP
jgi:hypothetical protein